MLEQFEIEEWTIMRWKKSKFLFKCISLGSNVSCVNMNFTYIVMLLK